MANFRLFSAFYDEVERGSGGNMAENDYSPTSVLGQVEHKLNTRF
ncbi:MAG: hypothetical protein NVSMB27_46180 [Ktedonobacteraceae bacterium]